MTSVQCRVAYSLYAAGRLVDHPSEGASQPRPVISGSIEGDIVDDSVALAIWGAFRTDPSGSWVSGL